MADVLFSETGVTATGAITPRTVPDRLASVYDVKDNDLTGNGLTDDSGALRILTAKVIAAGGGTILFPPGNYLMGSAVTWNTDADFGLNFKGYGPISNIFGNFAGFIFDRSLGTPNNTLGPRSFKGLKITNSNLAGSCIRMGSTILGSVENCVLTCGLVCFTAEDTAGSSSRGITVRNNIFRRSNTNVTGSRAIVQGGSGVVEGNDFVSFDEATTFYGGGISANGNRWERCNRAIILGTDSGGTDRGLAGCSITSSTMEGNWTGIDLAGTCSGIELSSIGIIGHDDSNAGVTTGIKGTEYSIRLRADKVTASEFTAINISQFHSIGGIYIEDYTTVRSYSTFANCFASIVGAGVPWRLSTKHAGFGFESSSCNVGSGSHAPLGTRYAYADLPGIGTRLEGDEIDVYDSTTAILGAVASGGGLNPARLYFDGTNWIVASA